MISVIVPAHNESSVIGRCLQSLTAGDAARETEIVVVANGCTDDTAAIAASFDGVRVIDIPVASKHAAIIAGDQAASYFPRAFVDADVEVTSDALHATARAMEETGASVGAPRLRADLAGCSWVVRAFYRVWLRLDWSTRAPVGSGVFMLSRAGREALGEFPDITNDDQYVHDRFHEHERLCLESHEFVIRPARNARSLITRRIRTVNGQHELRARFGDLPGQSTGPGWRELLRRNPRSVGDVAVYVAIKALALRGARRKRSRGDVTWERDHTSRVSRQAA